MGTDGGGGGGKKGGNGSKRPPEDKIDIENPSGEGDEDDSSLETSLELNLDPQQLASVRLDRPLLKLRLMPRRRRVITTAPGGGGTPPPMGGGIVTVPLLERQNGTGINQPIESGGGPPQLPNGVGGGTQPLLSERDRRIPQQPAGGGGTLPPNGNGSGNGDSNGSRGGDRPPPPRRNGDDNGDGGGDDSPPPSDHGQPRHHRGQRDKWVYVVQGPSGPPGQPGQDGRDGCNGHVPQLPRGMINVPGIAPAPLDTTGLENSFENLGRTMVDVLAMQQQTNLTLQDQIRRANDAQMDQTLAMHDLADITEQRMYDSMFAAVPIYHGKDDEDFDEWADQLEALCEISHQNIHHEMMGRSSAAVKKIIRSIDLNLRWSLAQQELKRCISDEKSIAHSAFKLNTLVQKPNENVCMYIIKYANLHQMVTGKRPEQETDQSHLTKFLTSINNMEISREICRQGIPHGTTLQDLFLKVTEKEVGQQLADAVALACSAQVMEIQDMGYEVNELGQIKKGYRGLQCWSCRGTDHLQRDCKLGHDDDDQFDGYDQKVGHMCNTLVTESDVTSSMMGEMYGQLASAQLRGRLYKTGYRRTKASPKEVQIGTTSQNAAITTGCRVSAIVTETPAALAPNTSQFRTPSRSVRLVTVPKGPVATQTMTVNSPSSPVPQTPIVSRRQIQDKTPQTLTNIGQSSNTNVTAPVWKVAVVAKRNLRSKAQPVATCQMLDTIEEVNEDSQVYPNFNFGVRQNQK